MWVCVCLPAVNVSAFDRASLCRLPALTMYLSFLLHIMHRAGRTGPELEMGRPKLDRSFFFGLVGLDVDGKTLLAERPSVSSPLSLSHARDAFPLLQLRTCQ